MENQTPTPQSTTTMRTLTQNGCGASLGDVDFALNHSTYKMARVYTKVDYSPAWELNEKVIDYIFLQQREY